MNTPATVTPRTIGNLILFVTGEAPRSRRARSNLGAALRAAGWEGAWPLEVDLLREPDKAIAFGMFATPALLRNDENGSRAVLYGDLSDTLYLMRFLSEL